MAVGIALQTIKERKLYREGFKTFEDYCRAKWAMGRTYAHYLVNGSQVAANLFTRVNILQPINEKQIRPLTVLEPEQQCEVWEEAVRSADGKIVTFKQVKALVKELTAPAPEPNPPSASHSGFAYSGPPRRAPFASPTPLPLGAPFRGHGGAVSGPESRRFIFPGGGLWAHFRLPVPPAGKFGQEKGDDTPCRFVNACCFRCQQRAVPRPWPWA